MLNFVWTNHVCKRSLLFRCVLSENSLKYALSLERYCQCNFRDNEYLCKLGKEYLNTPQYKFYTFFLDEICKLLTYYTLFYR